MVIVALGIELLLLYVLTRRLTQNLYIAVYLLTTSRPVAVGFLSLLFFPGTIIHELAHLFTAEILGVHTSGLTLVPEGIEQTEVRTGSVSIAQSDPIRRALIGVAPVFVGLGTLGLISYFLPGLWQQVALDAEVRELFSRATVYLLVLALYALFAVSNTMFSSSEDMEGFWPVALVLTLVGVAAYIVGIRISLSGNVWESVLAFFTSMATTVGWVTALNIGLLVGSNLLILGVEKLTKRKLVTRK